MSKQRGLSPILIIILIALALGGYLFYQKQTKSTPSQQTTQLSPTPIATSVPTSSVQNNISIQALNEGIKSKSLNSQNYNIEGYVINKNPCSCPKGTACSPCLPEILIAENKENTTGDSKNMYIRVDRIEDFQTGKKYKFSILLPLDRGKQGFSYERILIGSELIK